MQLSSYAVSISLVTFHNHYSSFICSSPSSPTSSSLLLLPLLLPRLILLRPSNQATRSTSFTHPLSPAVSHLLTTTPPQHTNTTHITPQTRRHQAYIASIIKAFLLPHFLSGILKKAFLQTKNALSSPWRA